jgi:hypothetical protein
VRISDVSPMSPSPAETTPEQRGGARRFQQLRLVTRFCVEEDRMFWAFLTLLLPELGLGEAPGKRLGAFCWRPGGQGWS